MVLHVLLGGGSKNRAAGYFVASGKPINTGKYFVWH